MAIVDNIFQRAYDLAVARAGKEWALLPPRAQIDAIYHEIRRIDAKRTDVSDRNLPTLHTPDLRTVHLEPE